MNAHRRLRTEPAMSAALQINASSLAADGSLICTNGIEFYVAPRMQEPCLRLSLKLPRASLLEQ
jgi:hypothetical protein